MIRCPTVHKCSLPAWGLHSDPWRLSMTPQLLHYPHTTRMEKELEDVTTSTARLKAALLLLPSPYDFGGSIGKLPSQPLLRALPVTVSFSLTTPALRPARTALNPHHLASCLGRKYSKPRVSTSRSLGDGNQRLADRLQLKVRAYLPAVTYLCICHVLFPLLSNVPPLRRAAPAATYKPVRFGSCLVE